MSSLFLRYPRLTLLTLGLIVVAGLSSYLVLPRMEDPILTERAAFILTSLPGADADQVESLVTEPIEDELRDIAEIKELRSSSRSSFSTITVELRDDVYAHEAPAVWSRIRDRMADAEVNLPANASKPKFERIEVTAYTRLIALLRDPRTDESSEPGAPSAAAASQALVTGDSAGADPPNDDPLADDPLAGDSPTALRAILRRHAEDLRERLLAVPGTKDVDIFGDAAEEILVEIQPEKVAALGMTPVEVSRLIASSDSRFSAGFLRGGNTDLLLELSGKLNSLERISSIPLRTGDGGRAVTVADVAEVRRSVVEPPDDLALVDGTPAVVLACLIRPNQRIDWWNAASEAVTNEYRAGLSPGIRMIEVFSQDGYVTQRLSDLLGNLMIGAASVMLVIFWLMGWRSALIVGAALPLSALMVLTGMRLMAIPIHQMSVTGLIIALGLLIDNAIVVVDEVEQKLRSGSSVRAAVEQTVHHLAVPLFGSTFTTALAFAPIAVMPGPAGEFVGAIALNVIVAIFSSLFLALTIVPALTGFLRRVAPATNPAASTITARSEQVSESGRTHWYLDGWRNTRLAEVYQRMLELVTIRPVVGILFGLALPLFGFFQARLLPEQFFPPADRDQIAIELELSAHSSLNETVAEAQRIRTVLLQRPDVEDVTWWIGRSAPPFYYNQIPSRRGQSQYAQALVKLDSAQNLPQRINRMQQQLDDEFSRGRVLVRQLEQGPPFEAPIEVQVFGPDIQQLQQISDQINRVLASIPEVTHVRSEVSDPQPRLTVRVDETEARLAGVTHRDVAEQMYGALEGAVGGLILEGTEELPVRVRVADSRRRTVDALESLDVLPAGAANRPGYAGIPLTSLGSIELTPGQAAIIREDRRRMTEVQAFLKAGVLPAPILAEFQDRFRRSGIRLPPGYELAYAGETAQRDDAIGNLLASVGVLAVLMVAALVLSFRSFRLAGLVGMVALLAVGLGLGALWLFGYPFGFMAIIGTMGLVGVAINDTIVVIAAIRGDEAARNGETAAIRRVVFRSTRHVVATSLTTMAGFLPLIVSGGNFWPPLAVTIAGGVGGATVLALIFVPAAYLVLMNRSFRRVPGAVSITPVVPVASVSD
ncbi:MAG: efflux RND transporter permease subunit [Fuerstiella sp.]